MHCNLQLYSRYLEWLVSLFFSLDACKKYEYVRLYTSHHNLDNAASLSLPPTSFQTLRPPIFDS